MAIGLPKLRFEYNYLALEPQGLPSIRTKALIGEHFGFGADGAIAIANGIEEARRLDAELQSLPEVAHVSSIADLIPNAEEPSERVPVGSFLTLLDGFDVTSADIDSIRDWIRAERTSLHGLPGRMRDDVNLCLDRLDSTIGDGDIAAFTTVMNQLVRTVWLRGMRHASHRPPAITDVPSAIRERYEIGSGHEYLLYIYPSKDIWQGEEILHFDDAVEAACPTATGLPRLSVGLARFLVRYARISCSVILAAAWAFLFVMLRSMKYALVAMAPMLLGMVWFLGFAGLVGFKINFYNVVVLPVIVGIGIDDGVHVVHGYLGASMSSAAAVIGRVGRALFLTSLTTAIGFGSALFYSHRGIASMGIALTVGTCFCFLLTVSLVPALLGKFGGVRHHRISRNSEIRIERQDVRHSQSTHELKRYAIDQ